MSMSIDGFVSGPNGEADWVFKSSDKESKAWAVEQAWDASLILMGRKTFEALSKYWPTSNDAFAPLMNQIPKAVFTQKGYKGFDPGHEPSPAETSWMTAQVCNGNLSEEINKLKAGDGKPIQAIGGGGFVRSLIATGLVDHFRLVIHPVILGGGLPIFNGVTTPAHLKLTNTKTFPGGIVVHEYSASHL